MRFLFLSIIFIIGCQPVETARQSGATNEEVYDGDSAASGDDVDPKYLRELPLLPLPWTITRSNFGCNNYDVTTEVGVLGDTVRNFIVVSVRTLNSGTQQLKFSTYEKDGTWTAEHSRLEFCVLLVDTDESIDDESPCPIKLESDYTITVSGDLKISYTETQRRSKCNSWTKDIFTGKGEIIEGIVTDFAIKSRTEEDTTNLESADSLLNGIP